MGKMFIGFFVTELPTRKPQFIDYLCNELTPAERRAVFTFTPQFVYLLFPELMVK